MTPSSAERSRESLVESRPRSDQDDDQVKDEVASDELSSPGASQAPTQKRRRVTRACDECRRKKIKCDGKQPCTHCTVYSYDCSYDQPSHRRRNPGPQYVEALEAKLHRAEVILHDLAPHVDLNDASLDATLNQVASSSSSQRDGMPNPSTHGSNESIPRKLSTQSSSNPNPDDAGLESMVRATGQLDLDDSGNWDYYGHSSGLSFLRRIRDQFGNVVSPEEAGGSRSTPFARARNIHQDFASPHAPNRIHDSPYESSGDVGASELPPREIALRLCSYALDDGGSIINLIYKPYFYKSFDRIYSLAPEDYENQDNRFLPLLYTTIALGCLFAKDEETEIDGYEDATGKGYKYFWAARELMDITDCRDLISLQAIIFMILFLQCSAKLSTCYSYIGIALRSALRMGLHRSFKDSFSPIEAESRRRAFWCIRKMDIYVGAMLGLPLTLSEQDFDQDLPIEVDDQYITETGILPMPAGSVPLAAAANANFRLCKILSKIIKCIYPIKGFQNTEQDPSRTYSIGFATICELETDLETWKESLPPELQPGGTKQPSHVGPMQQLLRMAYAHAQMMLYRPFLHYVSSSASLMSVDPRSYACAAACIGVSRNIIHITTEMTKEGLLIGSYWFTMYTTFFGVLSLLYFAVENPENATTPEVMRDAKEGKDTLAKLAKRSMAADRCTSTLNAVFENLQDVIEKGAKTRRAGANKKREAPGTPSSNPRTANSQPSQSKAVDSDIPQGGRTMPSNAPLPLRPPHSSRRAQRDTRTASRTGRTHQQRPNASSSFSTPSAMPEVPSSAPKTYSTPRFNQPDHFEQQQQQHPQQQRHQHQQQQQGHQQQQYNPQLQDSQYPGDIADLSSMMFPSADPFAYPNQPMTTLEQNYAYNRNIPNTQDMGQESYVPASTAASNTVSADEHIDVQLFGPLPPYLTQATQLNMYGDARDMNTNQRGQAGARAEMWSEQMRMRGFGNFNYDDVFGNDEEWRGTLP